MYGDINLGVGPVIENGFYYDMDLPSSVNVEDLRKIEKEMKKIINENIKIERVEVSREEAKTVSRNERSLEIRTFRSNS